MNEDEPVDAGIELGDLPMELVDRVRAATAHASYRSIHRRDDGYLVCALTGDRVVLMELALRENNSVAETTRTFLRSDVAIAAATTRAVSWRQSTLVSVESSPCLRIWLATSRPEASGRRARARAGSRRAWSRPRPRAGRRGARQWRNGRSMAPDRYDDHGRGQPSGGSLATRRRRPGRAR